MSNEIVNRVAKNTNLQVIDLEDFYPEGKRIVLDIKDWLMEGLLLKEKDFRAHIAQHNWEQYRSHFVALSCSTDAIIPGWAYMLISVHLATIAKKCVVGDLEDLETAIYQDLINQFDTRPYQDKFVIIKGCANKPVPQNAFVALTTKLQPVANSLMYGEACSSVPLYKKTKQTN